MSTHLGIVLSSTEAICLLQKMGTIQSSTRFAPLELVQDLCPLCCIRAAMYEAQVCMHDKIATASGKANRGHVHEPG